MEESLDTMNPKNDDLFDRVINSIKDRKKRVSKGLVNSLPWPFKRFSDEFIGLERGKIYQITAGTKAGKSKLTNFMFAYSMYDYIYTNNLPIKLVIKYFCLEESKDTLVAQFMSHVLFIKTKGKMIVSRATLMSTKNKEVPQPVIDELSKHEDYIRGFLKAVDYIEDIHHPFGIFKHLLEYAEHNGTQKTKTVMYGDEERVVDDIYVPNDPEEIVLTIVDHVSLLQPTKGEHLTDAITKLSSYLITLRNKYGYSSVIVQQQAMAQSSIEGLKFNNGEPTIANLGDSKLTARAVDVSFGVYSPFYNKVPEYEGYDIKFYKDNIRFLSVLIGREGGLGLKVPLYFNGACNFFSELPKPGSPDEAHSKKNVQQLRANEIR